MAKITYFLAGVYQGIKKKRPDGTPYFNLRVGIAFLCFLHYMEIGIVIKKCFGVDIITSSKEEFLTLFLIGATTIYFLITLIIPLSDLQEIEVDEKDVKRSYYGFFIYFFLNVPLLGCLIFTLQK